MTVNDLFNIRGNMYRRTYSKTKQFLLFSNTPVFI